MVQNILSAMDSDNINSIGDTVESNQVALIIKETFYEQFDSWNVPSFQNMIQLVAGNNTANPTVMSLPSNVKKILWIKYNWHASSSYDFRDVTYLEPATFIDQSIMCATNSGAFLSTGPNNVPLVVLNNKPPTYWTSFDNTTIYFDSWDSTLETTVETTNVMSYGQMIPDWVQTDLFVPPLDFNYFPLLLAESKSVCFDHLKQAPNQKEEQRSRRQQTSIQNDRWRAKQREYQANEPDYGRKSPSLRPTVFSTPGR